MLKLNDLFRSTAYLNWVITFKVPIEHQFDCFMYMTVLIRAYVLIMSITSVPDCTCLKILKLSLEPIYN